MKNEASNDLCSEFYAGPYAFSEPETKLLSEFISDSKRNFRLIVSLSGYGRKISYDSNGMNQDEIDDVRDIARAGVKNIKKSRFTIDSKSKSCGSFVQYAMHQTDTRYSYKISARNDEVNGLFVPASSIEENAEEMFDIIIGMVKSLKI